MFFHLLFALLNFESTLTVTIENCKSNKGKLFIALYDSEKAFMKEPQAISKKVVVIENGKAIIQFSALTQSEYAFVFFHDENNNGQLDKNIFGIPTEGYGFSNNAKGVFGPPSYEKSKITMKVGLNKTAVKLNY